MGSFQIIDIDNNIFKCLECDRLITLEAHKCEDNSYLYEEQSNNNE